MQDMKVRKFFLKKYVSYANNHKFMQFTLSITQCEKCAIKICVWNVDRDVNKIMNSNLDNESSRKR